MAVPVYEVLPHRRYYDGSPAVRCADWRKLADVIDRLLADPLGLRERHEAALKWYVREYHRRGEEVHAKKAQVFCLTIAEIDHFESPKSGAGDHHYQVVQKAIGCLAARGAGTA